MTDTEATCFTQSILAARPSLRCTAQETFCRKKRIELARKYRALFHSPLFQVRCDCIQWQLNPATVHHLASALLITRKRSAYFPYIDPLPMNFNQTTINGCIDIDISGEAESGEWENRPGSLRSRGSLHLPGFFSSHHQLGNALSNIAPTDGKRGNNHRAEP